MFVYEGTLSEKCKRYMVKREQKGGVIIISIISVIFMIPTVLLTLFMNWIFIVFSFALLSWPIIAATPLSKANCALIIPTKITIDLQEDIPYIAAEGKRFDVIRELSMVKTVVDMGEWYVFIFFFPHKSDRFVCEKALIRQGTIEEFEDYFAEEIIRKNP